MDSQGHKHRSELPENTILSAEALEKLANVAGIALFSLDVSTGDISMNRNTALLTGYELGDLPQSENTKEMLTLEEDRPQLKECMQALMTGQSDQYQLEYRMRRRDGSLVSILEHAMVYEWSDDGNPVRFASIAQDLSRLRLAEVKVRELEKEHRKLTEDSSESELAQQNHMLRAANAAAKLIIGGFNQDYPMLLVQSLQILGESVGADRAYIWRNREAEGQLCCFPRAEWSTYNSTIMPYKEDYHPYDELLPNWNESFSKGTPLLCPTQQLPKSVLLVLTPGSGQIENAGQIEQSEHTGHTEQSEHTGHTMLVPLILHGEFWGFVGFDRSEGIVAFTEDEAETIGSGTLVIASSISRWEAMAKLETARKAAMASTQAKGEFLSRMSHEIRTPMNAILGMTAIAKQSDDSEKIAYCLDKIEVSSRQLLGIINDVLDMSKIDANKLEISVDPFDFEAMLENVLKVVQVKLDEKHQDLFVDIAEPFDRLLQSDALRLSQVLINLLNNAMKFTPERGRVTVKVREHALSKDSSMLRVEVIDTGIGVEPEAQKRLFDSFEQADGGITREYGGTGLGLAICKKIISLMGGDIWVESAPGQGACFIFEVEVTWGDSLAHAAEAFIDSSATGASAHQPTPNSKSEGMWQTKTILLAEDIEINTEIVRALLEDTGVHIEAVPNGSEALKAVQEHVERYDLILMDLQMPVMDGLTATQRIRALEDSWAQRIPIIAMTANAFKEDEAASLAAGMNGHIAKPLVVDDMLSTIEKFIDEKQG